MDVHGWLKLLGLSIRTAYSLFVSILTLAWLLPIVRWLALRAYNSIPRVADFGLSAWTNTVAANKPLQVLVRVCDWLQFSWAVDKLNSAISWFEDIVNSGDAATITGMFLIFGSLMAYVAFTTQEKNASPTALSSGWLGVAILVQAGTSVGAYIAVGMVVYLIMSVLISIYYSHRGARVPAFFSAINHASVSFLGAAVLGPIWLIMVLYS